MTSPATSNASRADIDTALLLLSRLGVSVDDLVSGANANRPPVPTFTEFVPQVKAAMTAGTLKAYGTYWNRVVDRWGERRLDEPSPLEIERLSKELRASRVQRRNGRGGSGTEENFIAAIRCLYKRAVAEGYLAQADNPAAKVSKPRRQASLRHALRDDKLDKINEAAATTGDDPELDSLILRLHQETACRRMGALNLRPIDLDEGQCLVRLREKANTERWQPVSPTLMAHLTRHAQERNAPKNGRLLRYRNGRPITYRRYDYLWERIGEVLTWVAVQGISTHWIRHTILRWVERSFGYAVARAFAGHNERGGDVGSTVTYVKADIHEVAAALAALTGEPHPLAAQHD